MNPPENTKPEIAKQDSSNPNVEQPLTTEQAEAEAAELAKKQVPGTINMTEDVAENISESKEDAATGSNDPLEDKVKELFAGKENSEISKLANDVVKMKKNEFRDLFLSMLILFEEYMGAIGSTFGDLAYIGKKTSEEDLKYIEAAFKAPDKRYLEGRINAAHYKTNDVTSDSTGAISYGLFNREILVQNELKAILITDPDIEGKVAPYKEGSTTDLSLTRNCIVFFKHENNVVTGICEEEGGKISIVYYKDGARNTVDPSAVTVDTVLIPTTTDAAPQPAVNTEQQPVVNTQQPAVNTQPNSMPETPLEVKNTTETLNSSKPSIEEKK